MCVCFNLGTWLLDDMTMFNFVRCQAVLQSSGTNLFPNQQGMRVPVAPHLCKQLVVSVFYFSHSNGCVVISYFNLHFFDDKWCWLSLSMFIFNLHIFFVGMSIQILWLCLIVFFFSYCRVKHSLYILNRSSLSDKVFCKYFLLVCGSFLHSPNMYFFTAEAFNFNKVWLYFFFHESYFWCCIYNLINQHYLAFSYVFSRCFIVLILHLDLRSILRWIMWKV